MKVRQRLQFVFLGIYAIINCTNLSGQSFQYFEKNLAENNTVLGFNLNQNFATNSLTSGFVLDFLNGKFITNEQKDNSIANFENNEILAGEQFNLSLSYKGKLGESKNFLFVELGEAFFYETKFHEDIFILLFKGNKVFENKKALLNPLYIRSLQYLYLKAGFHRITEKYNLKLNIGYAGGQRLLDLNTENGSLYTAVDGRAIDLDLNLRSYDAGPENNSLFDFSGSGIFTDLGFTYNLTQNTQVGVGLDGLGFINWNDTRERNVDTFYHFDGAEISSVLDSFSVAIKDVEELKSSFIKEKEGVSHRTNLPYTAYVQLSQFLIPQFLQVQLKYGIIKSELTRPFLNSSINMYYSTNKLVGLNIDAGGYGDVSIGAQWAMCFSNKSSIHLYFNSISNLITPNREMNLTGGMVYRSAF